MLTLQLQLRSHHQSKIAFVLIKEILTPISLLEMFAAELLPNKLVKVTIIVNGISSGYLNMKVKNAQILHSKLFSIKTYFTLHRPVMISALCMEKNAWKLFFYSNGVNFIKSAVLLTKL